MSTLQRTIIKTYLHGLRVPLTTAELVTNNVGNSSWPPALAFENFEADAKRLVGSLIRDDELVHEGELQKAKVQHLVKAERLEVEAEERRAEIEAEAEADREAAQHARERAQAQAMQRERELEKQKADAQRKVNQETAKRQAAAASASQARSKAVTSQERGAARTRIAEQSAALDKRSEALKAAKKVETLDTALERTKVQRKRS